MAKKTATHMPQAFVFRHIHPVDLFHPISSLLPHRVVRRLGNHGRLALAACERVCACAGRFFLFTRSRLFRFSNVALAVALVDVADGADVAASNAIQLLRSLLQLVQLILNLACLLQVALHRRLRLKTTRNTSLKATFLLDTRQHEGKMATFCLRRSVFF